MDAQVEKFYKQATDNAKGHVFALTDAYERVSALCILDSGYYTQDYVNGYNEAINSICMEIARLSEWI